jgi:hypothetical protein
LNFRAFLHSELFVVVLWTTTVLPDFILLITPLTGSFCNFLATFVLSPSGNSGFVIVFVDFFRLTSLPDVLSLISPLSGFFRNFLATFELSLHLVTLAVCLLLLMFVYRLFGPIFAWNGTRTLMCLFGSSHTAVAWYASLRRAAHASAVLILLEASKIQKKC